jgi:hypothetical protein
LATSKGAARHADVKQCFRRIWEVLQKQNRKATLDNRALLTQELSRAGYQLGQDTVMPFSLFKKLLQTELALGIRSHQLQALSKAYCADTSSHRSEDFYINSDDFFKEALDWQQKRPTQNNSGQLSSRKQLFITKAEMAKKNKSAKKHTLVPANFDWGNHRQAQAGVMEKRIQSRIEAERAANRARSQTSREARPTVLAWGGGYGGNPIQLPSRGSESRTSRASRGHHSVQVRTGF